MCLHDCFFFSLFCGVCRKLKQFILCLVEKSLVTLAFDLLNLTGVKGLNGPPGFGRPRKFHAKRGWPRPKAQPAPWQTCWIFNKQKKRHKIKTSKNKMTKIVCNDAMLLKIQ